MIHVNTSGMTLVGGATGWKAADIKDIQLKFIDPCADTRIRKT